MGDIKNIENYQYALDFGENTVVVDNNFQLLACGYGFLGALGSGNYNDTNICYKCSFPCRECVSPS